MEIPEALEQVLDAYKKYYTINRETPASPFLAEAEFRLHDEQYFLIRSARISEVDSRELVFFSGVEKLDAQSYEQLEQAAWEEGLSRVRLSEYHRNTDVSLCILAGSVDPEAARRIRKARRYKSYRFGLGGFSQYRTVAYDLSSGTAVRSRLGEEMEKVVCNRLSNVMRRR